MKSKFFPAILLTAGLFYISCTSAPKSDEAKTSEAKEVTKNTSDQKWKLDTAASKIEWVGTKVTGYHTGQVPLKSGEIFVKDGEVTGGKFVMDLANMQVVGP